MELDVVQKKVIKSKVIPYVVLRGLINSGKTTAAVHRIVYLKNNYCLYDEDKIIMVTDNREKLKKLKELYEAVENKVELEYITLFSNSRDKVHLNTTEDIINRYFLEFEKYNKVKYEILSDLRRKREVICECIIDNKKRYPLVRIMNDNNLNFFIDEIAWIKSCNILGIDSYQNADRLGRRCKKGEGPQRLWKNSLEREAIYNLMVLYNERLRAAGFIDKEDKAIMALEQARSSKLLEYTHIIVDESQRLTKVEHELLKEIKNKRSYGSIIYILDREESNSSNSWLIKGRKLTSLFIDEKIKSYLFKNSFEQVNKLFNSSIPEKKQKDFKTLENYEYHDIRNHKSFSFMRDISNVSEIILSEKDGGNLFTEEELKELPVYNDIAAGEPIYINPEVQDKFYFPSCWIKGMKECFVLKVKGDSMINADINDGDFVIIRKQSMAQNNEIVAVDLDGSATLKRLKLNKEKAFLMPENEKYSPISIDDEGARIIGVAIGVLRSKN